MKAHKARQKLETPEKLKACKGRKKLKAWKKRLRTRNARKKLKTSKNVKI